jgi:predicted DNA-binding ribbon-helix-helix protein
MDDYRNITLTLPATVLGQLEHMAARRHMSVSQLLAQSLEAMAVRHVADYEQARVRHLAWLEHAADLGTQGQVTWSRESLHDR